MPLAVGAPGCLERNRDGWLRDCRTDRQTSSGAAASRASRHISAPGIHLHDKALQRLSLAEYC